jgi:NitT/TauT family transport system substrate-binding protein
MRTCVLAVLALLLSACGTAAPAPSATAVKVSYNTAAATDLPFYVAEEEGYFTAEKLNVTMVSMTPQVAIAALSKGEIDFMNSPSNSIEGTTNGLPFKVVWDSWDGAAWTLVGKSDIRSVQELKGRIVGTNNPGTAPYAYLRSGLRKNGLNVTDVQYVPLSGTSTVFASLTAGKIDAGVISPPFDGQALEQGFREVLFLGDLLELPSNGLSTTASYIAQHRPVVQGMIRALLKSERWIREHPDETTALVGKRLNASPSVARRTYERMLPLLTKNGEITDAGVQQNIELLQEATGKTIAIDRGQLVDFGPLHEVQKQ